METVLLGAILTQYDAIKGTLEEMKPFLNIDEETGRYYCRLIFVLKILFVIYAFDRSVKKHFSFIFEYAGNICSACKNPIFREIPPNILSAVVIFSLYKESLTSISSEFLTDIFVLAFSLKYAVEEYKKELNKISSIIFVLLFVQWYISRTANSEEFKLCTYLRVLVLLYLTYIPTMPNNPKYGHLLTYLYLLLFVWVFYKGDQQYGRHLYAMHQNKIKAEIGENVHTMLESERGLFDDHLKNLDLSNRSNCSDTENGQRSCYTLRKVEDRTIQNITEKLEKVSTPASFSSSIQDEDTTNTIKSDIKEIKKDGKNLDFETEKLKVHDIEQYLPSAFPKTTDIENEQKTADTVSKLSETVYTDGESRLDESNVKRKSINDKIDKLILLMENKEMTAQKTHFEEVPKSGMESNLKNSENENHVTVASQTVVNENKITDAGEVAENSVGIPEAVKIADNRQEKSESEDANMKPEKKESLNGKRKITFFKKRGEISGTATIKETAHDLRSEVGSDESAIQTITKSEGDRKKGMESTVKSSENENNVTAAILIAVNENKITNAGEVADNSAGISEAVKIADNRQETSESEDANINPEKTKSLNGKRKIKFFKKMRTISGTATSKTANDLRDKVGSNEIPIQTITKSESDRSGIQGTARGNSSSIVHKGKVNLIKFGRKEGKGLQIMNNGENKGTSLITKERRKQGKIKPGKVKIVKSAKKFLSNEPSSKSIGKKLDKLIKKDFLVTGNGSFGSEAKDPE